MANKNNDKLINFIIFVVGVLATLCIFLPALVVGKGDSQTSFSGLKVTFGSEIVGLGSLANSRLPFSFLALLAYLLPIVGGVLMLVANKKSLVLKICAVVLFLAATILLFLLPTYTKVVTETILGNASDKLGGSLAWGSIVAAVLSILGLLGSAYKIVK